MQKRVLLLSLLPAGLIWGYRFYLSLAAGYAVSKYCSGKQDGEPGRVKSVVVPVGKYEFHLHHWLLSLLLGITGAFKRSSVRTPNLFFGFLSGMALQGIYCYGDWHRIVRKRLAASQF